MAAIGVLGEWVSRSSPRHQDDAFLRARNAFVDTIGCMWAGAAEDAPERVRGAARHWGAGQSCALGAGRTSAPVAALVNGTCAHALDFDDNDTPAASHPSAVLVPAILAVAEEIDLGGSAALDAYIVALEVMARVGEAVNMLHYAKGWHATATIGALGAAAGCARLMGLEPRQASAALSLATSMAGGFKSQFGTMAKPVHAGLGAKAGVTAASLARAGIEASDETLDGQWSFLTLLAGPEAPGFVDLDKRLGAPLAILQYGLSLKRYPTCYYTARSIDALLDLRAAHGLQLSDADAIEVAIPDRNASILRFADPADPMEARFSIPYCLAAALADGELGLAQLTPAAVTRPELRPLMAKIAMRTYPAAADSADLSPDEPDTVTIRLTSGQSVSRTARHVRGSAADPLTEDELFEKFRRCAAIRLDARAAREAEAALRELQSLPSLEPVTRHFA